MSKEINHEGIATLYTSRGSITVSSGGCGCCADYEEVTLEGAIEAIDNEIEALTALKLKLGTEGVPA